MNIRCIASLMILLLLVSIPTFANSNLTKLLAQTETRIKSGETEQAYRTLKSQEDAFAGEPRFDFMLGWAASNSGHYTSAVYALERVLDIQPNHHRARAELAKAYYSLGENQAAQTEFKTLQTSELPAPVQTTINQFLTAINYRFDQRKSQLRFYFEGGAGSDSNVNSATDNATVPLPVFGNIEVALNESSTETDSPFATIAGGLRDSKPLRSNLVFYTKTNLDYRETFDASEFATRILNTDIGLSFLHGNNQFHTALINQNFAVDNRTHRNLNGLNAQWHHTLNTNNALSSYIQYAQLKYPGQRLRDTDQTSAGFAWSHSFNGPTHAIFFAGAYFGIDDEVSALTPQMGRDFIGLRTGGHIYLGQNRLFAQINYVSSEYAGQDPLFLAIREDEHTSLNTGVDFKLGDWTVTPNLTYASNTSNISIHEFDRTQIFVQAHLDF